MFMLCRPAKDSILYGYTGKWYVTILVASYAAKWTYIIGHCMCYDVHAINNFSCMWTLKVLFQPECIKEATC